MQIIHFEDLDSTNLEARRRAEAGQIGPLWIRADRQTQGRGRRGREWTSEPGNLFCTGLYPHFGDLRQAAQMSFVAALALYNTVETYLPSHIISLKWPNDVLISGKKTAGILLESGQSNDTPWIAVGIGLNLVSHPENSDTAATHILGHINPNQLSAPEPVVPEPHTTGAILAARFDHWRHVLVTEGFTPVREAWTARAKGLGEVVTVRLPNETFSGIALGLGPDGELQVRLEGGTMRDVHAGDVFFGLQG